LFFIEKKHLLEDRREEVKLMAESRCFLLKKEYDKRERILEVLISKWEKREKGRSYAKSWRFGIA
jgi:hypothetical protein